MNPHRKPADLLFAAVRVGLCIYHLHRLAVAVGDVTERKWAAATRSKNDNGP